MTHRPSTNGTSQGPSGWCDKLRNALTASLSTIFGSRSSSRRSNTSAVVPDLEQQGGGENVGVAVQQMEPAILSRVGQRFIPGVDDRPVELHPLKQVVVDVVRPLADLKVTVRSRTAPHRPATPLPVSSPPGPHPHRAAAGSERTAMPGHCSRSAARTAARGNSHGSQTWPRSSDRHCSG